LFHIPTDRGQYCDISEQKPETAKRLEDSLNRWKNEMASQIQKDSRPFTLGHPDFPYTQLPARDGIPHGNIKRDRGSPNCSWYTNWTDTDDKITWPVKVLSEGDYRVDLYYTCPREDLGSTVELSFGSSKVSGKITQPHDPPLKGMEYERVKLPEYYVKAFMPMNLGIIHLKKGTGTLTLKATDIPGDQALDFRLLMFERIDTP
jgi:hypothetical protein